MTDELLEAGRLRIIFNELKQDKHRDFITFKDFETAIKTFNIQLMRGLNQDHPEFSNYCKELFMSLCQSTADYSTN